MGSERLAAGKRPPPTPQAAQRKKLANITNLQPVEELPVKSDLLQQEVAKLKIQVQSQADHIEKLEVSLEQKSAQNEEIIQHYYRQYKELEQTRQEMKLLQHENTQMCSVYRISKSELQSQLEEANEQIRRLTEEKEKKPSKSPPAAPPTTQAKPTKKRRSTKVTSSKALDWERRPPAASRVSSPLVETEEAEEAAAVAAAAAVRPRAVSTSGRPVRRAVETVASYKEPPLNTKMRRACID